MGKQKEIERIGKIMCEEFNSEICGNECECDNKVIAEKLISAGYGNVKQAVKEFAEKVKYESAMTFVKQEHIAVCEILDGLVKEVCGE